MASSNAVVGQLTRVPLGSGQPVVGGIDAASRQGRELRRERKVAALLEYKRPCCKTCTGKGCVGVVASKRILPGDRVALHLIDQPLTAQAQEFGGLLLIVPGFVQGFANHPSLHLCDGLFND